MENVPGIIDNFSNQLFTSANVSRRAVEDGSMRKSINPSISVYIHPFQAPQTESNAWATNIASIVKNPIDLNFNINTFSKEFLDSVLHLEPPKKVVQYTASSSSTAIKPAAKPGRRSVKVVKPKSSVSTSDEMDDIPSPPVPPAKRARVSRTGLPSNFYDTVRPLFDEFWDKKFDNPQVDAAFFARITSLNCQEYGLPAFAELSSSLPIIKEKMRGHQYISVDEFHYDFYQMFGNIFRYYPEQHAAIDAAKELKSQFDTKWKLLEERFSW